MSLSAMNVAAQVSNSDYEAKLLKKEMRAKKLREIASKIAEKRRIIEELQVGPAIKETEKDEGTTDTGSSSEGDAGYDSESPDEVSKLVATARAAIKQLKAGTDKETPSKLEIEKEEVSTDTGSASEGEGASDSENSEMCCKLSASAKAFYPPPPGLELLPPPGLQEELLQSPPGLESPTVSLSADAKPFEFDVERPKTKLTARARLFKSVVPLPLVASKEAPLFQPAGLKAEVPCGGDEKIMWFSSRRRM